MNWIRFIDVLLSIGVGLVFLGVLSRAYLRFWKRKYVPYALQIAAGNEPDPDKQSIHWSGLVVLVVSIAWLVARVR